MIRYFVTYKYWNGTETATFTHSLGRCFDLENAECRARDRYNASGYQILGVRPETSLEALLHKAFRFVIRTLRMTIGVFAGLFAYFWLADSMPNIGNVPLGDLTLGMIFSAIFSAALAMGGASLCWMVAFGDGPEDDR